MVNAGVLVSCCLQLFLAVLRGVFFTILKGFCLHIVKLEALLLTYNASGKWSIYGENDGSLSQRRQEL